MMDQSKNDMEANIGYLSEKHVILDCVEEEAKSATATLNDRLTAMELSVQDLGKHQIRLAGIFVQEHFKMLQQFQQQKDKLKATINDRVQEAISHAKDQTMLDMRDSLGTTLCDVVKFHEEIVKQELSSRASASASASASACDSEDLQLRRELKKLVTELRKDIDVVHSDLKRHMNETEKRLVTLETGIVGQHKAIPDSSGNGLDASSQLRLLQDLTDPRDRLLMKDLTESCSLAEQSLPHTPPLPQTDSLSQSCPTLGGFEAMLKRPSLGSPCTGSPRSLGSPRTVGPPRVARHRVSSPTGVEVGTLFQELADSNDGSGTPKLVHSPRRSSGSPLSPYSLDRLRSDGAQSVDDPVKQDTSLQPGTSTVDIPARPCNRSSGDDSVTSNCASVPPTATYTSLRPQLSQLHTLNERRSLPVLSRLRRSQSPALRHPILQWTPMNGGR